MLPFVSAAQTYPSKIIRVINPAVPGGNSDLLFRVLSPKMNEALGQQLVMDYRLGAGATVGTEAVARSAPDGYTVLITAASHVTNPALVKTAVRLHQGFLRTRADRRGAAGAPNTPTMSEAGLPGFVVRS